MHQAVLLQETIEAFGIKPGQRYIDATAGEGGHTEAIAVLGASVMALDRDPRQVRKLIKKFTNSERILAVEGNFADIEELAKKHQFFPVDGVLFDLGLSMEQLNTAGRGLSFKKTTEPLDMRLDDRTELTAEELINTLDEKNLYEILGRNAEEKYSLAISRAIVRARAIRKLKTVGDLTRVIDEVMGKSDSRTYARIFQAMRIEVNQEFENLKKGLRGAAAVIGREGKIAVISFHSLEDRIVKRFIAENGMHQIHKKIIISDSGQSFERSAKLRVFTKRQ